VTARRLSAHGLWLLATAAAVAGASLAARSASGAGTGDDDGARDTVILPRRARPRLALPEPRGAGAGENAGATRCGACHLVEGWEKVRFNHDPTGFPLRGVHVDTSCKSCHGKSFDTPVADTCSGCHRDRHAGEFGLHCEGCHDEKSWRPLFQADAHRRTNFPLVGKHALIPCAECHGNLRDRTFARAAVRCDACHEGDFMRTAAISVDHPANNYSRECQTCHNTFRFFPASVAAHDACFRITSGSHHGVRCLTCHTTLTSATFTGACATGTSTCAECHSHACARSDVQHKNVMGYQCVNTKCYECHKIGGL
jgi:hypothetical protein